MSRWSLKNIQSFIVIILVTLQCSSFSAVAAIHPQSGYWIGVQQLGDWKSEEEAVYPELIRQVQKWVENIDSLNVQVALSSIPANKTQINLEKLKFQLAQATEKLKKVLVSTDNKETTSVLFNRMIELRKRSSGNSNLGPEIQESLVIEAAYYWKQGRWALSTAAAERAIKIHPKGQISSLAEWDSLSSANFNIDAFDSFIEQIKAKQTRNCIIEIDTVPNFVEVKVNGFLMGSIKEVALVPGGAHHLELIAKGFKSREQIVHCKGLEHKRLKISLEQNREPSQIEVAKLNRMSNSKSMILIEPIKDTFKLFLYTPGNEMDEIPLRNPLRLANLGLGSDLIVGPSTDATIALFEKHKLLASNLQVTEIGKNNDSSLLQNSVNAGVKTGKTTWLESPVFWGIIGGVLLGGAVTYFANQRGNSTSVSSDWE